MKKKTIKNCDRFSSQKNAAKYPSEFRKGHFNDEREVKAITKALKYIPAKSKILDLPCGTGRLTKMLIHAGFNITAADRSLEMVKQTKGNLDKYQSEPGAEKSHVRLFQEDIIQGTRFCNNEFDAVICHRLFHHLVDSDIRKVAIKELRRITSGPVIFSFFNSFSFSSCAKSIKNIVRKYRPTDRIPISKKMNYS